MSENSRATPPSPSESLPGFAGEGGRLPHGEGSDAGARQPPGGDDLLPSILWSAMALGGFATGLSSLAGAVRYKLIALHLGPGGLGLFGQLTGLAMTAALIGAFPAGAGFSRLLAEALAASDERRAGTVVRTVVLAALLPSTLLALVLAPFTGAIAAAFLADPSLSSWVRWLLPCIPLGAVAGIGNGVLQGHRLYRRLALLETLRAVGSVVLVAALLAAGGMEGIARYPLALALLLTVLVVPSAGRATLSAVRSPGAWWEPRVSRELVRYGVAQVVTSLALTLTTLSIGRLLIGRHGAAAAGLYRALWLISETAVAIVIGARSSYFFPSFCRADDPSSRQRAWDRISLAFLEFTTPVLATAALLGPWIVPLLFSRDFAPVTALLALHLSGDFLRAGTGITAIPLLARGSLAALVALNLGWCALLWLLFAHWQGLGIAGYVRAYAVSTLAHFVAQLAVVRWLFGLRTSWAARARFAIGLGVLLLLVDGAPPAARWLASLIVVAWLAHLLVQWRGRSPEEVEGGRTGPPPPG